jgi:hypothetical protein
MAYARSGNEDDMFVYSGTFTPNPKFAGKWVAISKMHESIDKVSEKEMVKRIRYAYKMLDAKKKRTGRNRYRPDYLILNDDGRVSKAGNKFWTDNLLVDIDRGEAVKMELHKVGDETYLFVTHGGYQPTKPEDWHPGYDIYEREK